jgi:hypothetical protein
MRLDAALAPAAPLPHAYRQAMVWSMYEVVTRRGRYTERLLESPIFEERDEAEQWVSDFLKRHPPRFAGDVEEAIEVQWVRVEAS